MKIELDLTRRGDAASPAPRSLAGLSLPALKAEMEALGAAYQAFKRGGIQGIFTQGLGGSPGEEVAV